eukprot:scaffold4679_cov81-Skeletonema_dohrnii-CCMP3373.AAC.3
MIEFVGHNTAALNASSCCVYFGFVSNAEFCSSIHDVWETDLVDYCISCNDSDTSFEVCIHCNQILCAFDCSDSWNCTDCKITYCKHCREEDARVADVMVTFCDYGYCEPYCSKCRLSSCKNGDNDCVDCKSMVFAMLLEESNEKQARINSLLEECNSMQARIDSQQEEMERSKSIMFTSEYPPITIRIKDMAGETLVTIERTTKMETLFQAFAMKKNLSLEALRFTLRGETIDPIATAASLDLVDMIEINAAW